MVFDHQWSKIFLSGTGLVLLIMVIGGCGDQGPDSPEEEERFSRQQRIAAEVDSVLKDQYQLWYPRVIDQEHGGFLSRFTYDWRPEGAQDKFIVTQARHVWSTSKMAHHNEPHRDFEKYGKHGFQFMREVMWDREHGGFFEMVTRKGKVITGEDGQIRKRLYGNAFAIYGLAAYYRVSEDKEALRLAQETFHWLERGAYDRKHGGYFNSLTREGRPYDEDFPKDYNSSIHMLEALAELHLVWPDSLLQNRLYEMFRIVRDTIVTDKGYMNLYFREDWSPVTYKDSSRSLQEEHQATDHITFGHDIETAFLLLEAAHSLGFDADSTLKKAKKMVDHTIDHAWDEKEGGIYDYGYYFQGDDSLTVTQTSKEWWSQVEALHSLLIMADYFAGDPRNYAGNFVRQWQYIKKYMLDHEHGGWYRGGIDENPEERTSPKATIWKGNYHTIRGLLRSRELLEKMSQNRHPIK
ncbi:AGE family epimerase/isomerase [Fodinibius sp.]|uniref:AGE family epimerase/isomerase n=1 Tax=Fodinibius sp. TaxID=1872440 RepID=UPI003566A93C